MPEEKTKAKRQRKNKPAKKANTRYVHAVQEGFQAQLTKLKHRVESLEHRKKKKGLSPDERSHLKTLKESFGDDKDGYLAARKDYLKEQKTIKREAREAAAPAMPKGAPREMHPDWTPEMKDRHTGIRGMPKEKRSEEYAKFYREYGLPDTRPRKPQRAGKKPSLEEAKEKLKDLRDEEKELNREMDKAQGDPAAAEEVGKALADNLEQQVDVASVGADQAQREGDKASEEMMDRVVHHAEEKLHQVNGDLQSRYRPTAFGGALSGRGMLSRWG